MWWNNYVGIPFKWHGMDRKGCSCWGLVRLIQKDVFYKDLPIFMDIETEASKGNIDENPYFSYGEEISLGEEKEGDILHMWCYYKGKKLPLHVGTILGNGKVLHIEEGTSSIIENYKKSQRCKSRVIGAYRIV